MFSWSPSEQQGPGTFPIRVRVIDDAAIALSDSIEFEITVVEVNAAPRISPITPITVDEGQSIQFAIRAEDPDMPAGQLRFALEGSVPTGATVDPVTGQFAWKPGFNAAGVYEFTVRVLNDGSPALGALEHFTVSVTDVPTTVVTSVDVTMVRKAVADVLIHFSAALEPAAASLTDNYRIASSAGRDGIFGTSDDRLISLRAAEYDANLRRVRLTPTKPLNLASFVVVTLNGNTRLVDTRGNLFDGDRDGIPGGIGTVMLGTHISYADRNGDAVSLALAGGGFMVLTRDSTLEAEQLQLIKTVPGRSALSGKIKAKSPAGDGITHIPSITGAAGVNRIGLRSPPFVIGNVAASLVDRLLESGELTGRP